MGVKGTADCMTWVISDSLGTWAVCVLMCAKPYCELPPQGGVDHAMVWLIVCVSFRSAERLIWLSLLQSTSEPSKSWMAAEESGEEIGLWTITLPQSRSPQGHGNSSWITWLVRVSPRLSQSHPESKHTDATFKLCKVCILKWSRSHQAINLLLKWWQW